MYRWLVNHLSTLGVFGVVMGALILFAVLLALVIGTLRPNIDKGHYKSATTAITGTFALLYGLIFALSISNLSSKNDTAASTAQSEATTLAEMVRDTRGLPVAIRVQVRDTIQAYTLAVANNEFKTMQDGKLSLVASTALDNMYAIYQSYASSPGTTGSIASSGVSKLDNITALRRTRLDLSQEQLPGLLRTLLVLGVVLFIILSFPTSISSRRVQVLVMGGIAAFLGFSFALTVVLDYPFSGSTAVQSSVFKTGVLAQFFPTAPPTPLDKLKVVTPTVTDLVGEWSSAVYKNGVIVFREVNGNIEATYRYDSGGFIGQVNAEGVLNGWWCEEPGRTAPADAGDVQWRLLKTKPGQPLELDGRWQNGDTGPFIGGWSLQKVSTTEPVDLAAAFSDPSRFCSGPDSPVAPTTTTTTTTTTTVLPTTTTTVLPTTPTTVRRREPVVIRPATTTTVAPTTTTTVPPTTTTTAPPKKKPPPFQL